ncbi:PAS domain-containing protein [Kiloniella sp.]|uniref:PAS domain-containing protein n=1 Tax=Kiloniella sp. TaxID=1938587 RepID=UPI003B0261C3
MADIICPQNQEFFDYWNSIHPVETLPKLSSFRPEAVPKLLPAFTIYELVSPDCILIRKGGTAIRQRGNYEEKGSNYLDLVAPERREKAAGAFFALYDQPCGMRVIMRHTLMTGAYVTFEGLGLPFINDKGGKPIIYFTNHEIKNPDQYVPASKKALEGMVLMQRDFIDIGFGVSDYKY